jgi:hypothetical protein
MNLRQREGNDSDPFRHFSCGFAWTGAFLAGAVSIRGANGSGDFADVPSGVFPGWPPWRDRSVLVHSDSTPDFLYLALGHPQ